MRKLANFLLCLTFLTFSVVAQASVIGLPQGPISSGGGEVSCLVDESKILVDNIPVCLSPYGDRVKEPGAGPN